MRKGNFSRTIIRTRVKAILDLVRGGKDVPRIEREIALLTLDIFGALKAGILPKKEGCRCFRKIDYALAQTLRAKMSKDFCDLLNEGILLDEIKGSYGPSMEDIFTPALKILNRAAKAFV